MGLDTFGDVTVDKDGKLLSQAQVLRNVVEEGVLADQVGIDFIGVGEHHRDDFAVSAPDVVLAAIASRTKRIHLGSAVTVLSSDDPIRVFQRFSTLDALSNGRAEVILGRGSFTESFPLFGFSLNDYERLFSEKLDLFAELSEAGAGHLEGLGPPGTEGPDRLSAGRERHAEDLDRRRRQPGIGGARRQLRPAADARHHRRRPGALPPVRRSLPSRRRAVAEAGAADRRAFAGPYRRDRRGGAHAALARLQGDARPHRRRARLGSDQPARFNAEADMGSLYVGSPETVAKKIVNTVKALGVSRFDMKYSSGTLPHEHMMKSIELYGTKVMPMVRDLLANIDLVERTTQSAVLFSYPFRHVEASDPKRTQPEAGCGRPRRGEAPTNTARATGAGTWQARQRR